MKMTNAMAIWKALRSMSARMYSFQSILWAGITPASLYVKFSIGLRTLSSLLGVQANTRVTYGARSRLSVITNAKIRIMTEIWIRSINWTQFLRVTHVWTPF